jgi:hypothetical protein
VKLVEAEATGPIEGEEAIVTPPRPPHRRVSVSLVFTICVLAGLVTTIYLVFPARHRAIVGEAIARHRDASPTWDLVAPTAGELHAWAVGVAGRDVPLPPPSLPVIGAVRASLDDTAAIRLKVGDDVVTYLVQRGRGVAPGDERDDGELRAFEWRVGGYACVAVGPASSAARWRPLLTRAGS